MLPSYWEFFGGVYDHRYGIHRIKGDVGGKDFGLIEYSRRATRIP
jgi:hypothetical protein